LSPLGHSVKIMIVNTKSIYEPPLSSEPNLEEMSNTQLRQKFVHHEIYMLAVGWFYYYLGSLLLGLTSLTVWLYLSLNIKLFILTTFTCILSGLLFIIIGCGIRHFDSWARIPSIIAGYIAMLLFPVGTLAGGVCVYLLHSHAVHEIFTSKYQIAYAINRKGLPRFGWLGLSLGFLTGISLWITVLLFKDHFGIT